MQPELPPLGFALRGACFMTGTDPELLRQAPPRDHASVMTIALIMVLVWIWQTLVFTLTAHMLADEMQHFRPEFAAVAALLATVVLLVDSYAIVRSAHYMQGLAQLKRGGLDVPGHLGLQIRNGLQSVFRVALATVFAQLAAVAVMLWIFAPEILHRLALNALRANAPIEQRIAADYDATSNRMITEIGQLTAAKAKAQTDAGAFRLDALQGPVEDPELKPAIDTVRRAEQTRLEAERRLARIPVRDELARRAAAQRLAAKRAELLQAQNRVDALRAQAQATLDQRQEAVQARLSETQAAEQRHAARIDALEKAHAVRVAGRESSIRATMEKDPAFQTPDRGLLARAGALGQLMEDPWTFTVATLIHLALFGIELAAVLCKLLTCVPSAYAVTLASEEYAHDAETVDALYRRIGQPPTEPPEVDLPEVAPPSGPPDAGGMAAETAPSAANDDDAAEPDRDSMAARLRNAAEAARMQAVARARAANAKARKADAEPLADGVGRQPEEPAARDVTEARSDEDSLTLAENILDGASRRGRGRPAGSKNRSRPANDSGWVDGSDVA